MNTTWTPNGYLPNGTFQKHYDTGVWVRIHRHHSGRFEVRASQGLHMRYPVEAGFATIEAAMAYADSAFGQPW